MKTKIFTILLILLTLSGCATLGGERTVNVTGEQIAQKLNEKLALPISLLKIFDVNLSNSLVTFDQASGRINSTMDTQLSSKLLDKTLAGKLGISGKLRFDAATSSVVLDEPKIDNINFAGAGGKFADLFNALAKTVGGDMLKGLTLYKVNPAELTFGGTQYSPKDMVVTDKGLQITLSPQR